MKQVKDITAAVGIRAFADAIGVKPPAVSNMRAANSIPARKYLLVCDLCDRNGLARPPFDLFSFEAPSGTPAAPSDRAAS